MAGIGGNREEIEGFRGGGARNRKGKTGRDWGGFGGLGVPMMNRDSRRVVSGAW